MPPNPPNPTTRIDNLPGTGYTFDKFKLATLDQNNTAVCVFVASKNDATGTLIDRKILLSPLANTGPFTDTPAVLNDAFIVLDANVGDLHYLDTFISPVNTVFCVFCYKNTNDNVDHFVITRSEGTYGRFILCNDIPLPAGFKNIEAKMLNHRIVFVVVDQGNNIQAIASDAGH